MIGTATPDWLAEAARRHPETLAWASRGVRLSYRDLEAAVARAAGWLADAGLGPESRVALLLPTGTTFVVLLHAALRLGAVPVPLNGRLTAHELDRLLADAEPDLFVHDGRPSAEALVGQRQLRASRLDPHEPPVASPLPPKARYDLSATALLVYTSGTTGEPKGVPLSRANLFAAALASAQNLGHLPDDRWLLLLPLHHVGGLSILMRSALFATGVVAQDPFDAVAANHLIETEAVTLTSVVTVMLRRMLDARGPKPYPPSLRAVLVGGGPVPPAIIEEAWSRGLPALPTYGLTETSAQAVTATRGEARQHPSLAGRPLLFTEVAILDPSGSSLPPGQEGEIAVRGPAVFHGYFRRPDLTAAVLRDGWLLTGDVGRLDEEGRLTVLDRRSDLIVSGGENVYPAEVEAALLLHPDVAEAGVYGEPDPFWGQRVAAVVVPREGAHCEPEELQTFLRQHLAGYKLPRTIRLAASLPRTAGGKLQRQRLRTWPEGEGP